MKATLIDGKSIAKDIRAMIKNHVAVLKSDHRITPALAVILVGDDPASEIYVRNKEAVAAKAGIHSTVYRLAKKTSQDEVLALIHKLNADAKIHGILVQLPLPRQIDAATVLKTVDPKKDVDGLHIENAGRLALGLSGMVPCTPMGCLVLIRRVLPHLAGKRAVVIGRSNLVGKPMAQLLLRESCTVTVAHSRTHDLPALCREADIVVAATGKARMVKKDWIRPGAVVIDVGITRADDGTIAGDVDFDAVSTVAGAITPVPGGVGPMTIACLLYNTLAAACREAELTVPELR